MISLRQLRSEESDGANLKIWDIPSTPRTMIFTSSSSDGKRAYYSSVREDGMGYTDIYLITIPEGIKTWTRWLPT